VSRLIAVAVFALSLVAFAQPAPPPPGLAGTWVLDPERSDRIDAIADFLKVDGMTRLFAPKKPEQRITVAAGSVTITGTAGKPETFVLDGTTPTQFKLFNAKGTVVARAQADALVLEGQLTVEGTTHKLTTQRRIQGDEMTVVTQLGEPVALTFKRVFVRAK
jgi:hypothetical protein